MNFDKVYGSNPNFFTAGQTDAKIVEAVKKLSRDKKVLELGAGQGEVAIAIAKEGFDTLATDSSAVGVDQIKKKAAELNLTNLKAEVRDMRLGITAEYDAIVCIRSLHYLSRAEGLKLIEQMKSQTNSGGINAVVALTQDSGFYTLLSEQGRFYVTSQEMMESYKEWKILEFSETWGYSKWKNEQGERAKLCQVTLIAVKP